MIDWHSIEYWQVWKKKWQISIPVLSLVLCVGLSDVEKARALGQIEADISQNEVVANFGVSPSAVSKWKTNYRAPGDVKVRRRNGLPQTTTPQEHQFITLLPKFRVGGSLLEKDSSAL